MEVLTIAETRATPSIDFDLKKGTLAIKGRSIPENSFDFYAPLMKALELYVASPQPLTNVDFALIYFNTSSSKSVLKVLKTLSTINRHGNKVKVNWYYDSTDEDQLETAHDLEAACELNFNYISVDPE